jgi:hypothetical protein
MTATVEHSFIRCSTVRLLNKIMRNASDEAWDAWMNREIYALSTRTNVNR